MPFRNISTTKRFPSIKLERAKEFFFRERRTHTFCHFFAAPFCLLLRLTCLHTRHILKSSPSPTVQQRALLREKRATHKKKEKKNTARPYFFITSTTVCRKKGNPQKMLLFFEVNHTFFFVQHATCYITKHRRERSSQVGIHFATE